MKIANGKRTYVYHKYYDDRTKVSFMNMEIKIKVFF